MYKTVPSRLRQSISPDDSSPTSTSPSSQQQPSHTPSSDSRSRRTAVRQRQSKKMSLTRTYQVAATARSKLGSEARRPEHRLRHLVGHANLLDSLMIELADAERRQEQWFNETVENVATTSTSTIPLSSKSIEHVRWADTVVEDPDEDATDDDDDDDDDDDASSDFSSDYDEDAEELLSQMPLVRLRSPPVQIISKEVSASSSDGETDIDLDVYDEDEDIDVYYPDEEYDEAHALARTYSRSSPPELIHDDEASSSSSDEEEEAVSPLPLSKQEQQRLAEDLGLAYHSVKGERGELDPDALRSRSLVQTI